MIEIGLDTKGGEQAGRPENPWEDDLLGRQKDADFLYKFLIAQSRKRAAQSENRSYVLNIDAKWGDGKSFFLSRFRRQLSNSGHIAVYVNAWGDDFADDPLTAVMAAIDDEVKSHAKPETAIAKAWEAAKSTGGRVAGLIAKGLAVRAASFVLTTPVATALADAVAAGIIAKDIGASVEAEGAGLVSDAIRSAIDKTGEETVSDFVAMKKSIESFRSKLAAFVDAIEINDDVPAPFFVLVDELDRCRPPYAIAMLERVKHLFDVPGVVFLIATDSTQLCHAVGAVYGSGFDSRSYLTRFFDRTYVFEPPAVSEFVEYLIRTNPIELRKIRGIKDYTAKDFMKIFFNKSDLSLRNIARVFDIIRTITEVWQESVEIEIVLMLPLTVEFQREPQAIEKLGADPDFLEKYDWNLQFKWQDIDFSVKHEEVGVRSLIKALFDLAKSDLSRVVRRERLEGFVEPWIYEVAQIEYNLRYAGRRVVSGSPSVLSRYPDFVRQAGKISTVELYTER